jgi:MoxR-like ATPase
MRAMADSDARRSAALSHFAHFFEELEGIFVERRDPLRQIALGLLAREHVLMTGPPGTGKSRLASLVLARIVDAETNKPSLFAKQLTESTVQTELIGPVDFRTLMDSGRTEHFTQDGILGSVHAFLDEVLDGRDMLLRATLNLLEERELKQGQRITRGVIECAVMTTNRYLTEALEENRHTLLAFIDRIAFVSFVPRSFAAPENLQRVMEASITASRGPQQRLTIQDVDVLQGMIDEVQVSPALCARVVALVRAFEARTGVVERSDPSFLSTRYISVRTAVRLAKLLKVICVFDKATRRPERALVAEASDLELLRLALMVVGPEPAQLEGLLAQEHEPRERRQLLIMKAEQELFDQSLAEVAAKLGPLVDTPIVESKEASEPTPVVAAPAPKEVELAIDAMDLDGHQLKPVEALLVRSRAMEKADPTLLPVTREMRSRTLGALTSHAAYGRWATEEQSDPDAWVKAFQAAVNLREALLAEGADIHDPGGYMDRWSVAFRRLEERVHQALDARAATLAQGVRGGDLQSLLTALSGMQPIFQYYEDTFARLAPSASPERLRLRVLKKRLAPLIGEMVRTAPIQKRGDAVALTRAVMRDLDALDVREAVSKEEQLHWIAQRLLGRETARTSVATEPSLEHYRALRQASERASLALVLSEVALVLEARSAQEPRGAVAVARTLLATLHEGERSVIVRTDLAALEENVAFLERWLAEGCELEALMQVAFEESALLRCSLEAQLLAELLPDALKEAAAMEARIHALSNALEALQSAYRTKANDAAWNEALSRA